MTRYAFLTDTYETEILKIAGTWETFPDDSMTFRPAPKSCTVLEQFEHQLKSEGAWMRDMLGVDVGESFRPNTQSARLSRNTQPMPLSVWPSSGRRTIRGGKRRLDSSMCRVHGHGSWFAGSIIPPIIAGSLSCTCGFSSNACHRCTAQRPIPTARLFIVSIEHKSYPGLHLSDTTSLPNPV